MGSEREAVSMEKWLEHARKKLVPAAKASQVMALIVPDGEPDLKVALEVGLMVLLDKPFLLLVFEDRPVPGNLARLARATVQADVNDSEGTQARLREAVKKLDAELHG